MRPSREYAQMSAAGWVDSDWNRLYIQFYIEQINLWFINVLPRGMQRVTLLAGLHTEKGQIGQRLLSGIRTTVPVEKLKNWIMWEGVHSFLYAVLGQMFRMCPSRCSYFWLNSRTRVLETAKAIPLISKFYTISTLSVRDYKAHRISSPLLYWDRECGHPYDANQLHVHFLSARLKYCLGDYDAITLDDLAARNLPITKAQSWRSKKSDR